MPTALPGILASMATIGLLRLHPFTAMDQLVGQVTTSISVLVASTRRAVQTVVGMVSPSVVWRTRLDKRSQQIVSIKKRP